MWTRRIIALLVGLLCSLTGALSAQPQYTLTDLGVFEPSAIAGPWVVGVDQPIIPGGVPIRLDLDTGARLVLPHAGYGAQTTAILDTGEAIGHIWQPFPNGACCGDTWGALWETDGTLHYLPGSVAGVSTFPFGINRQRAVAGTADVIWSKNSCSFARVVFQEPPKPFATMNWTYTL
jgi:hypothetical protein